MLVNKNTTVHCQSRNVNCWIKSLFLFCFCAQKVFSSLHNIKVEPLLPMCGSDTLGFHQKYLNLCSEDERRSYGCGTTWGWVINDRNFIFGWTYPLTTVAN